MVGWVDRRLPAEVVEQWCGRVFGAEYAAVVAGLVRPALHLVRAEPGADVAFSLGGAPRSSGPWPVHPELGPMEFVARLDLSVVAEAGVCPALTATGVVEVFVPPVEDSDEGYVGDFEDRHALVVRAVSAGDVAAEAPEGVVESPYTPLRAVLADSAPDWDLLQQVLPEGVIEDHDERTDELADLFYAHAVGDLEIPRHTVGGNPPIAGQNPPAVELGWADGDGDGPRGPFSHLLTIDFDEEAEMEFLDGGTLHIILDGDQIAAIDPLAPNAYLLVGSM